MDLRTKYLYLLEGLKDKYGLSYHADHPDIHEFYEGPIPLFKLIYATTEQGVPKLLLAVHLDINPVDAIQWHLRIRDLHNEIYITECYFKDDNGETFMGQKAETIRMYKNQQKIISEWSRDKEDTKKFLEAKIVGRSKHQPIAHVDKEKAIHEFNKMTYDDKKKYH